MPPSTYRERQLQAIRALESALASGARLGTIVPITADYVSDRRTCLTSVTFIPAEIGARIESELIPALRAEQPQHYFYPPGSLHATIQNVRTISDPPNFSLQDVDVVRSIFKNAVPTHKTFELHLDGLLRLPTSLSIAAFSDETLGQLALDLRARLRDGGMPDDKQYSNSDVVFANVTICRYVETPSAAFLDIAEQFLDHAFGSFTVRSIDLIQTNAICHPQKTAVFDTFALSPA